MSKKDKPPARNSHPSRAGSSANHNSLNIDISNLHYHPNDLSELRKIAEISPELAEKLIAQKDRSEDRETSSFRIGIVSTLLLLALLIIGTVYVVIYAGIIALICLIAVILAVALLIRVILTGEWSETNWVGHIIKGLVTIAGGRVASESDDAHKNDQKED